MKTSPEGRALIESCEGVVLSVYRNLCFVDSITISDIEPR